jgi:putative membrane protein
MAAERTFLAWIRTGLALMGFGFVVARFGWFLREVAAASAPVAPGGHAFSIGIGTGLVALGALVNLVAAGGYARYPGRWSNQAGTCYTHPVLGLLVAIILFMIGAATVVYLIRYG